MNGALTSGSRSASHSVGGVINHFPSSFSSTSSSRAKLQAKKYNSIPLVLLTHVRQVIFTNAQHFLSFSELCLHTHIGETDYHC